LNEYHLPTLQYVYLLHKQCEAKLAVLLEQQKDLSSAIDQLIADIEAGRKYMKVYKQMKMYNDPEFKS
jgi:hypothetical protein